MKQAYDFTMQITEDDGFKHYLQGILNDYHKTVYPRMEVPKSKKYSFHVTDGKGSVVGGALIWVYWNWLEISLIALEKEVRGNGLGRQLMAMIEEKARQENCKWSRVETFENELGFYQKMGYRIVGHLEDYPQGHHYYWMRKDLQ